MLRYAVAGQAAAPSASGEPYAVLWNPSTTKRLYVEQVVIEDPHATILSRPGLVRCTTRGTPGSTITPDADNSLDSSGIAPPSGAELNLADFTVSPTLQPPRLNIYNISFTGGSIHIILGDLAIPAGTGLCIECVANLATNDVTVVWGE